MWQCITHWDQDYYTENKRDIQRFEGYRDLRLKGRKWARFSKAPAIPADDTSQCNWVFVHTLGTSRILRKDRATNLRSPWPMHLGTVRETKKAASIPSSTTAQIVTSFRSINPFAMTKSILIADLSKHRVTRGTAQSRSWSQCHTNRQNIGLLGVLPYLWCFSERNWFVLAWDHVWGSNTSESKGRQTREGRYRSGMLASRQYANHLRKSFMGYVFWLSSSRKKVIPGSWHFWVRDNSIYLSSNDTTSDIHWTVSFGPTQSKIARSYSYAAPWHVRG